MIVGDCSLPRFIIFKNKKIAEKIRGANPPKLQEAVKKLAAEADSDGAGGFTTAGRWTALAALQGYQYIIDQVDIRGIELLNSSSDSGTTDAVRWPKAIIPLRCREAKGQSHVDMWQGHRLDGDRDKVKLDGIRIVGETGESKDPGNLEKVGDHERWYTARMDVHFEE
ncbi:uncharacterized protein KY384_002497 [Bacidia gigantensis]|uniref:uncharacterized protein n=1 Tax=Bacidia gigantensis TaxID=2732470 RepID=UPI001D04E256|nr:uncharacterized protein KY384_002497 [Bacidia gigantensis]KAG8532620.1 hypothetical protein KY384_002497 [Bacidia gigantensis]